MANSLFIPNNYFVIPPPPRVSASFSSKPITPPPQPLLGFSNLIFLLEVLSPSMTDAQGEVIESLLPMVDKFERAKLQIRPETEKKIDTSYQGIYKQFIEIMKSLHVASVPTMGKPFDPSVHEAIAPEESQEFPEGIIIQEICRGFLLGGRLLRPAMVKVSIGPGSKKTPVATEKSSGSPATAASVEN